MNAKQKEHFLSILHSWQGQLQLEQDRTADKLQKNAQTFQMKPIELLTKKNSLLN